MLLEDLPTLRVVEQRPARWAWWKTCRELAPDQDTQRLDKPRPISSQELKTGRPNGGRLIPLIDLKCRSASIPIGRSEFLSRMSVEFALEGEQLCGVAHADQVLPLELHSKRRPKPQSSLAIQSETLAEN
jgi:hypothetical protein